eukprot:scaffold160710_cov14-Tisochrysis_lutea.AAC.1
MPKDGAGMPCLFFCSCVSAAVLECCCAPWVLQEQACAHSVASGGGGAEMAVFKRRAHNVALPSGMVFCRGMRAALLLLEWQLLLSTAPHSRLTMCTMTSALLLGLGKMRQGRLCRPELAT